MSTVAANNPRLAGSLASSKRLFGPWHRYAVYAVHTRFDAVEWFVADAEQTDAVTGQPAVIRQAPTEIEAMARLEDHQGYDFDLNPLGDPMEYAEFALFGYKPEPDEWGG
jgi:hypothetical protein